MLVNICILQKRRINRLQTVFGWNIHFVDSTQSLHGNPFVVLDISRWTKISSWEFFWSLVSDTIYFNLMKPLFFRAFRGYMDSSSGWTSCKSNKRLPQIWWNLSFRWCWPRSPKTQWERYMDSVHMQGENKPIINNTIICAMKLLPLNLWCA